MKNIIFYLLLSLSLTSCTSCVSVIYEKSGPKIQRKFFDGKIVLGRNISPGHVLWVLGMEDDKYPDMSTEKNEAGLKIFKLNASYSHFGVIWNRIITVGKPYGPNDKLCDIIFSKYSPEALMAESNDLVSRIVDNYGKPDETGYDNDSGSMWHAWDDGSTTLIVTYSIRDMRKDNPTTFCGLGQDEPSFLHSLSMSFIDDKSFEKKEPKNQF